ncbi:MAG: protein translocase subunit SecD [Pseudomonadota bacterium]
MLPLDGSPPLQTTATNKYPGWLYGLLVAVLMFGALYALPNIFGEDLAVQISGIRSQEITEEVLDKVNTVLTTAEVPFKSIELDKGNGLIRFNSAEDQLRAKTLLYDEFDNNRFSVALNLASAAPAWLLALNANPMKLGLDLRGGIYFLMEVNMEMAIEKREIQTAEDIKVNFREKKIRGVVVRRDKNGGITARFSKEEVRDEAYSELRSEYRGRLTLTKSELGNRYLIKASLTEQEIKEIRDYAIKQNIITLRNRINEIGVAEPVVQREGADRIVVQLPGVQDSAEARRILGRTASLEFRMVNEEADVQAALAGRIPPDSELLYTREGQPLVVRNKIIVGGEHITDANTSRDENGMPQVNITLDGIGGKIMEDATKKYVKKLKASVWVEYKTKVTKDADGNEVKELIVEKDVINYARIQSQYGSRFRITGIYDAKEATDLALSLRSGALLAPVHIVEERTVGPSLGQENIDKGILSIQIGFVAVLIFMVLYYRVFGIIASAALVTNLLLIVAFMSLLGATLTLPGMAGIVLTVGMAVDANVLIFERIREELRDGVSTQQAIFAGYDKAVSTIADANITTLVAAIVLLAFGTGPIKGFAVTLAIGILTSMLTAIVGSRAIVNLIYGNKPNVKLSI